MLLYKTGGGVGLGGYPRAYSCLCSIEPVRTHNILHQVTSFYNCIFIYRDRCGASAAEPIRSDDWRPPGVDLPAGNYYIYGKRKRRCYHGCYTRKIDA